MLCMLKLNSIGFRTLVFLNFLYQKTSYWWARKGRISVSGSPGLSGSDFDQKWKKSDGNDLYLFCSRFKNCLLQVWKNLLLVWKLHGSRFQKLHKTCSSFRKKFKPGATHPKTWSQTIISQDQSKFKSGAKNFQTWSWMFFKRSTFYFKLEISCFEIWSRKIDLINASPKIVAFLKFSFA